jgi:hypothetical protein
VIPPGLEIDPLARHRTMPRTVPQAASIRANLAPAGRGKPALSHQPGRRGERHGNPAGSGQVAWAAPAGAGAAAGLVVTYVVAVERTSAYGTLEAAAKGG